MTKIGQRRERGNNKKVEKIVGYGGTFPKCRSQGVLHMFIGRGEETGRKANSRGCRRNLDKEEAIGWGRQNRGPESRWTKFASYIKYPRNRSWNENSIQEMEEKQDRKGEETKQMFNCEQSPGLN